MIEIYCPVCKRVNSGDAERCWYCQALLRKTPSAGEPSDPGLASGLPEKPGIQPPENLTPPTQDQALPAEEIPDWLARIRARKQADQGGIPVQKQPSAESKTGEAPDWLKEMGGVDVPDLVPSTPPVEESPERTITPEPEKTPVYHPEEDHEIDWLKDLGTSQATEDAVSKEGISETDLPDLEPIGEIESTTDQGFIPQEEENQPVEVPPVIHGVEAETELGQDTPSSSGEVPSIPSIVTEDQEAEIPDYMQSMTESEPEILPELGEIPEQENPAQQEIPDWLLEDEAASKEIEFSAEPLILSPEGQDRGPEPDDFGLTSREAESELPQELAELSSDGSGTAGILSGIEGVLQDSDLSARGGKTRDYSAGLSASQQQLAHATLFTEILKGRPSEKRAAEKSSPLSTGLKIVKTLLALILLASVILPHFYTTKPAAPSNLFPAELVSTISILQSLPTSRPVLLVANYEAGLSGEMSLTSDAVIYHLVSRNIPLALLSTNVVGSATLPDLVSRIASRNGSYLVDQQVVDLGYLPGGVIGFHALANDLRGTLPFTSSLEPVWVKPVMQNVTRLPDFGAIILITDDPEVARSWIEQVGSGLESTPLLLVLSAQAAPMVQPYFSSGQIDGFVAGEGQAVIYEDLRATAESATRLFNSYQPPIILAAIAIFIGGIVSLVLYSTPERKKETKRNAS